MASEKLIPLVHSRPEIWDQSSIYYSDKKAKLEAWTIIAGELNISVALARQRWTSIRDCFRKELKKILKMTQETGDPDAYTPKWKHFRPLLFLKDQIVKTCDPEISTFITDDILLPFQQKVSEENGENKQMQEQFLEEGEEWSSNSSGLDYVDISPGKDHEQEFFSQYNMPKKQLDEKYFIESYSNFQRISNYNVDEDYHFVMSILPSIRKIPQERKTLFKMNILNMIMEEEMSSNKNNSEYSFQENNK